jgi:hypothetical protein
MNAKMIGISLVLILGLQAAAGAQTWVRGFGPYILGTPMSTVLQADPQLSQGSGYPIWSSRVPSTRYGRVMSAPVGGYTYPARVGLQFWQGTLASICVVWDSNAFDSVDDWRSAGRALRAQLQQTYGAITTMDQVVGDDDMMYEATDAQNNFLTAFTDPHHFSLHMCYLSGPFRQAVDATPKPSVSY